MIVWGKELSVEVVQTTKYLNTAQTRIGTTIARLSGLIERLLKHTLIFYSLIYRFISSVIKSGPVRVARSTPEAQPVF